MEQLNRFGRMHLDYLNTCRPELLLTPLSILPTAVPVR